MTHVTVRWGIALLLGGLGTACATTGGGGGSRAGAPLFASDPYAGLDRTRVVAAAMSGPDREIATQGARAELARVLETRIEAVLDSTERVMRVAGDGAGDVRAEEEVTSRIRVTTDRILEGVEVHDVAAVGDRIWVRVVLPRAPALRRIEDAFRQKSDEFEGFHGSADTVADPLERLRWLRRCVGSLAELEALSREHGVVDPGGNRLPLPATLESLEAEIEAVRFSGLRPAVVIRGPSADELRAVLEEVLTELGCRPVGDASTADLVVTGDVELEPVDPVETEFGTQHFVRVSLVLTVQETTSGRVAGKVTFGPRRVGHRGRREAERKALQELTAEVRGRVRELLRSHLAGES